MLRNSLILLALGLFVPQIATAAVWSVKADCKEGDWTVDVILGDLMIDASCSDGMEYDENFNVDGLVTEGSIAATSSGQTMCDLRLGSDVKSTLECATKSEDSTGLEFEEKVEVEVELEEEEEDEEEEE